MGFVEGSLPSWPVWRETRMFLARVVESDLFFFCSLHDEVDSQDCGDEQ